MSRARNIKPGFFRNDRLAECDPLARILFAGLWCMADREGRLEDRPKRIKAECLPYDDCDADRLLEQLSDRGFITRYVIDGSAFIAINEFGKHQNPHVKEAASTIPAPGEHSASTVQAPEIPERAGLIPDSPSLIPDSKKEACPKAAPSDQPTDIAKAKADRAERLAAVTEDAIETFNASPFTVAHGGRVPNVTKVNREKRRQQVARAIRVIREICTEEFGGPEITRDFWLGYWQIVNGDAFASGRQAGTGAHSNWRPDFEYLTRPDTITALYDRAEAAA